VLLFSIAVIPLLWLAVKIGREWSTSHDDRHLVKLLPFARIDVDEIAWWDALPKQAWASASITIPIKKMRKKA